MRPHKCDATSCALYVASCLYGCPSRAALEHWVDSMVSTVSPRADPVCREYRGTLET